MVELQISRVHQLPGRILRPLGLRLVRLVAQPQVSVKDVLVHQEGQKFLPPLFQQIGAEPGRFEQFVPQLFSCSQALADLVKQSRVSGHIGLRLPSLLEVNVWLSG